MSGERKAGKKENFISEQTIADYLLAHPDFFENHADLLSRLKLQHPTGSAVSLIERQVELLRTQNRQLERKLVDLLEVARANDSLLERIHHLAVGLLSTATLEGRLVALQEILRNRFGADNVVFFLFRESSVDGLGFVRHMDREDTELALLDKFLAAGKPQCGRLKEDQLALLFGDNAGRAASTALIPLEPGSDLGFIAISNRHADHFSPTLGTQFLARIGELASCAIRPLLKA